jgi:hypothetical protein
MAQLRDMDTTRRYGATVAAAGLQMLLSTRDESCCLPAYDRSTSIGFRMTRDTSPLESTSFQSTGSINDPMKWATCGRWSGEWTATNCRLSVIEPNSCRGLATTRGVVAEQSI